MLGWKGSSEGPSELEQFLQSRQSEGTADSRGEFTLARDEALAKLAQFQLPYESAWVVKLVQAIVAGGCRCDIRVDLLATSVRFLFSSPGFSLDEVEEGFYNPQLSPNRSLRHLLSGLWAAGLRNKWGFQVALPGQSTTLIWDGQTLNRVPPKISEIRPASRSRL